MSADTMTGWLPDWKDRRLPLRPIDKALANRFKPLALFPDGDRERQECLVEGILPAKGIVGLVADRQSFKSFVALDLAFHISYGMEWFGRKVVQGSVVYVSAEDADGMNDRRLAWRHAHPGKGDLGYFLPLGGRPALGTKDGDAADLIQAIRQLAGLPVLIVIDTLSKVLHAEDENGAGMIALMANAEQMVDAFDCVVVLIHHARRGTGRGRGAAQFGDNSQGELALRRSAKAMEAVLTVNRLKGFPEGERILLKMSEPIALQRMEHGKPITSLVIESAGAEAKGQGRSDRDRRGRGGAGRHASSAFVASRKSARLS
jgi:hypothetical protein